MGSAKFTLLTTLGSLLILAGIINWVSPFIPTQIAGTTPSPSPPKILASKPSNFGIILAKNFTRVILYVCSITKEGISSVVFSDDFHPQGITLNYPLNPVPEKLIWIPDLNDDSKVDDVDLNLLESVYGAKVGDSNYKKSYDFDNDGTIGMTDLVTLLEYRYTYVYSAPYTPPSITSPTKFKFRFVAIDTYGNSVVLEGNYTLALNVETYKGKWFIDDKEVSTNSMLIVNSSSITVKFVADTVFPNTTVTVTAKGETTFLEQSASATNVWSKVLTVHGITILDLKATAQEVYVNSVSVTVIAPGALEVNVPSVILIASGTVLLATAFSSRKKEGIF